MDVKDVLSLLENNNYSYNYVRRYKNSAFRIKLENGVSVYCYDKGNVYAQGKKGNKIMNLLNPELKKNNLNNKVFIVYGHDVETKQATKLMLESNGFEPITIDDFPSNGKTIIEKLTDSLTQVSKAIVLVTPDDELLFNGNNIKRARQNVIFEYGMFMAYLGRSKVVYVLKKDDKYEAPSDLDGIIYLAFENGIFEIKDKILKELGVN